MLLLLINMQAPSPLQSAVSVLVKDKHVKGNDRADGACSAPSSSPLGNTVTTRLQTKGPTSWDKPSILHWRSAALTTWPRSGDEVTTGCNSSLNTKHPTHKDSRHLHSGNEGLEAAGACLCVRVRAGYLKWATCSSPCQSTAGCQWVQ